MLSGEVQRIAPRHLVGAALCTVAFSVLALLPWLSTPPEDVGRGSVSPPAAGGGAQPQADGPAEPPLEVQPSAELDAPTEDPYFTSPWSSPCLQALNRTGDAADGGGAAEGPADGGSAGGQARAPDPPGQLQRGGSTASLAWVESEGFIGDESDADWKLQRFIHRSQLSCQKSIRHLCRECDPRIFWQLHYEPSFSCRFERRVGYLGDGGKWMCDPHRIAEKASRGEPCIMYSVGSNGQYDFEEGVHHLMPACEIHTIDREPWQNYTSNPPPPYIAYHVHTLGMLEGQTPLPDIVEELGHAGKTIDIFKIDCEYCEWDTYQTWFGKGVSIRQILVEVHGTHRGVGAHAFFAFLFKLGYVIFHKEANTIARSELTVEFSLLRLSPSFSCAEGLCE